MSDRLPPDFDCLYDIKTMRDVKRIAAGEPHHSNATVADLVQCFIDCKLEVPAFLMEAHEKASMPLGMPPIMVDYKDFAHFMALDDINKEQVEEIRRFTLLNEASIEQMNENQQTIDKLKATLAVCNNKVIIDIALSEIIRLRAEVKRLNLLIGYT